MKRINLRLPLVCVLSLCLGIFSAYKLLFGNVWWLVAVCAAAVCSGALFAVFRKKYWAVCFVALIFVAVGFADFHIARLVRHEDECRVQNGVLTGRVIDLGRNGSESANTVYLEDCSFEGESLQGRVMLYVYDGSEFSTGDRVSVYGTLRNAYAVTSELRTSYVRNRIFYQLTDADNWITQSGELTLAERVRKFVYQTTADNMQGEGGVAYALLTGDRNALDDSKEESFKAAGIIHLLAVSGLHVGFVIGVFGFVLKRLRLSAFCELIVLLVPIGFYAYVCDFTPSVVRAVIMAVVVYVSKMLRGRYDLLTSLSIAALFILLVQPLFLFDLGFQLSVLSVFGIATMFLQIDRWCARRKFNKHVKKLFQTVALSASCIAATAFLSAYVFENFTWVGLFVNILAIPAVFVSFVLCFAGMLPWVFRYLLWLADKALHAVAAVAEFVSEFELSLSVKTLVWGVFISLALLFVLGGYVNLSGRAKKTVFSVGTALMILSVGCAYLPQRCSNSVAVFCGFDDSAIVATSENGEAAAVCTLDAYNASQIVDSLEGKYVASFTLYITDSAETDAEALELLCDSLPVSKVFFWDRSSTDGAAEVLLRRQITWVVAEFNCIYGNEVTVQSVYDGGLAGAVVKVGKISVAVVIGSEEKTRHFAEIRSDVDFYAVTCAEKTYAERNLKTLTYYQQALNGNFGTNRYGNFTITENSDIITLNFTE